MFLSTVCTSKLQDKRNAWHSHWWLPKILLLVACLIVSTFAPTSWIQIYGQSPSIVVPPPTYIYGADPSCIFVIICEIINCSLMLSFFV